MFAVQSCTALCKCCATLHMLIMYASLPTLLWVCVCVCVCANAASTLPDAGEDANEQPGQSSTAVQDHQQQQQPQQPSALPPQPQQAAGQPGRRGPPTLGLQLDVGSHVETGEWKSNGVWVKKEKQELAVPSNLQIIPAEDLVKVSRASHHQGRACTQA